MALLKRRGVPTRGTPTTTTRGESRGAQPLWQGSGGVPQRSSISATTCGGSPEGTASLAGVWGCPPEILYFYYYCGGSPEGHSRFGRGLGVSPRDPLFLLLRAGESRGAQPLWQGSGGVPQRSFISTTTCGGVQRGTASLAGVWGCPPEILYFYYYMRGESRGAQPLWQGSGGVPQRSSISATTCGGVQRGTASLAGVWGCPPEILYFCPLPSRKGAGE